VAPPNKLWAVLHARLAMVRTRFATGRSPIIPRAAMILE
jgi:hypothetical protein